LQMEAAAVAGGSSDPSTFRFTKVFVSNMDSKTYVAANMEAKFKKYAGTVVKVEHLREGTANPFTIVTMQTLSEAQTAAFLLDRLECTVKTHGDQHDIIQPDMRVVTRETETSDINLLPHPRIDNTLVLENVPLSMSEEYLKEILRDITEELLLVTRVKSMDSIGMNSDRTQSLAFVSVRTAAAADKLIQVGGHFLLGHHLPPLMVPKSKTLDCALNVCRHWTG
jgi:hypothetical protein